MIPKQKRLRVESMIGYRNWPESELQLADDFSDAQLSQLHTFPHMLPSELKQHEAVSAFDSERSRLRAQAAQNCRTQDEVINAFAEVDRRLSPVTYATRVVSQAPRPATSLSDEERHVAKVMGMTPSEFLEAKNKVAKHDYDVHGISPQASPTPAAPAAPYRRLDENNLPEYLREGWPKWTTAERAKIRDVYEYGCLGGSAAVSR